MIRTRRGGVVGRFSSSPWGRRVFIGLVALIITSAVYVLSTGPVVVVVIRTGLYHSGYAEKGLQIVYWPLIKLADSEAAVGEWIEAYVGWWMEITQTSY